MFDKPEEPTYTLDDLLAGRSLGQVLADRPGDVAAGRRPRQVPGELGRVLAEHRAETSAMGVLLSARAEQAVAGRRCYRCSLAGVGQLTATFAHPVFGDCCYAAENLCDLGTQLFEVVGAGQSVHALQGQFLAAVQDGGECGAAECAGVGPLPFAAQLFADSLLALFAGWAYDKRTHDHTYAARRAGDRVRGEHSDNHPGITPAQLLHLVAEDERVRRAEQQLAPVDATEADWNSLGEPGDRPGPEELAGWYGLSREQWAATATVVVSWLAASADARYLDADACS